MAGSIGKAAFLLQDAWSWTNFGTNYYPWYPSTRCFVPERGSIPATIMPQIALMVSKIADLSTE
jgi:hypothetical protein